MSKRGQEWIDRNVDYDEWQWLGGMLNMDCRYAPEIMSRMREQGLIVEAA